MKCLEVKELASGMVLTKPVRNHHDEILLREGALLTDKRIKVLKSWGIGQVWVSDEEEGKWHGYGAGHSVTSERDTRAGVTLKKKFRDVLDDPIMAEIMRVADRLLEERYSQSHEKHGQR